MSLRSDLGDHFPRLTALWLPFPVGLAGRLRGFEVDPLVGGCGTAARSARSEVRLGASTAIGSDMFRSGFFFG